MIPSKSQPFPVADEGRWAISDLDTAGETQYFGYLDAHGFWYIMQLTATTARYCAGESGYATNWEGRAELSYGYFNTIF